MPPPKDTVSTLCSRVQPPCGTVGHAVSSPSCEYTWLINGCLSHLYSVQCCVCGHPMTTCLTSWGKRKAIKHALVNYVGMVDNPEKMSTWVSVVVITGCHNKIPLTGWLKQPKFIFSLFWKLEVQGRALAGLIPSEASLLGW